MSIRRLNGVRQARYLPGQRLDETKLYSAGQLFSAILTEQPPASSKQPAACLNETRAAVIEVIVSQLAS